jgi:hypothetical protein
VQFAVIEVSIAWPWCWRYSTAEPYRAAWLLIFIAAVEVGGTVIPLFPCALWAAIREVRDGDSD